ncbi:MAG: CapA family protein [Planctomycetes bacterium]|jgi:poly-gamma-glutamate synthesis protein (capsule biosynthesis protein)|nr:CapA family protein [Planctomycetota bacterium]
MNRKDALVIIICSLVLTALVCGGLIVFKWLYDYQQNYAGLTSVTGLTVDYRSNKDSGYYPNNLPANREQPVRLLFFGDLMLDRHVGEKIAARGLDHLFSELATTSGVALAEYDLVSANLEGVVTDAGAHYPPVMGYDFAFAPELIGGLKKYNFNFFNLSNNHLADQGEHGIIETRTNLSALGFGYAGCQDGVIGDCSLNKLEVRSKKIGLAGFSLIYSAPATEKMAEIVTELASTTDLVIVNVHWGVEYEHQFSRSQQALAHALIDAGADIIIGHHPHVVQGMEIYQGKPIFYSLGNFIFDQYFSPDTQEGLAVGLALSGGNPDISLLPLKSKSSQVALMAGEEKEEFLEKLAGWSELDEEHEKQILNGNLLLAEF